jgi:hypothetical protein
MAGRGRVPKEHRTREYDSPQLEELTAAPVADRTLPMDLLPDGDVWHPATLRWWAAWVESPLTADLPAVDWRELEACAVLHHEFMSKRSTALAAELRLRVAKWGATPEDRMRLKVKVTTGEQAEGPAPRAGVTDMTSRRDRLSKGA